MSQSTETKKEEVVKTKPVKSKAPKAVEARGLFPTHEALGKVEAKKLEFEKDSLAAVLISQLKVINALPAEKQGEARAVMRDALTKHKFDGRIYSKATIQTQSHIAAKYLEVLER